MRRVKANTNKVARAATRDSHFAELGGHLSQRAHVLSQQRRQLRKRLRSCTPSPITGRASALAGFQQTIHEQECRAGERAHTD